MMRSGQYKISGSLGSKNTASNDGSIAGQFRTNSSELPPTDSPVPEFPHMNSLVVTINKMSSESRPLNKSCENLSGPRGAVNRVEQRVKSFLQRGEARLRQAEDPLSPSTPQPPSDDGWQYGHVVTLPRRPRLSLALSHSALNHLSTSSDTASCLSASSGYSSSSSSSYGSFKSSASSNCSTLPRKKNRSGSEEHPQSSTSSSCTLVDNPMYDITPGTDPRHQGLVNESHKRRSSSSMKRDFVYDLPTSADPRTYDPKLNRRRSASVPRHDSIFDVVTDIDLQQYNGLREQNKRRGSVPYQVQNIDRMDSYCNGASSLQQSPDVDPIYDTIPGEDSLCHYRRSSPTQPQEQHLYECTRSTRLLLTPDSGTHGGLDSLEESALDSLDLSDPRVESLDGNIFKEDQVAKECREYFEKRLKNAETLKKRWSMCSSDSGADSGGDSEISPVSFASPPIPLLEPSSEEMESASGGEQGDISIDFCSSSEPEGKSLSLSKKTPLDQKMDYLRKEIASLMKQDDQLFKQLLTLHDSISALKSNPQHPRRPPSPVSLDSFTEEEEEEEEEDEEEDHVGVKEINDKDLHLEEHEIEKNVEDEETLSDVDEGLETDHSLSHSISPTSTLSSKSSRNSTLSSKSCRDSTLSSNCSKDSHYSTVEHLDCTNAFLNDSIIRADSINLTANKNSKSGKIIMEDMTNTSPLSTSFSSNKIMRRYSITTNDDFNVNITINNEEVSSGRNDNVLLSNSTPYLSKSSCYLSKSDPETTNLNSNKPLGGSLESFSPRTGRRFVRTRVSIPPSARNRDRSARPESFRMSSDMASHTRVLLKARSFAGASLRESPTHRKTGGRGFVRTSLREGELTYNRDKSRFRDQGASKLELLSKRFTSVPAESSDEVYYCQSEDNVSYGSLPPNPEDALDFLDYSSETLESTSIIIVNNSETEIHSDTDYKTNCITDTATKTNTVEDHENTFTFNNDPQDEDESQSYNKDIDFSYQQDVLGSPINFINKSKPSHSHAEQHFYLNATDLSQAYQKSQKLRARSFTGMMNPRTLPAIPQSPPREVLDDFDPSAKSSSSLKVTGGPELEKKARITTMNRRARVSRDGYTFRFSSDLGLTSSSKVAHSSKREVFV